MCPTFFTCLIFVFAKAHKISLIQKYLQLYQHFFLSQIYAIEYAILDQFWVFFFENITP